jgi:mutator protein MutT
MTTAAIPIGIAVVENAGQYLVGVRGPNSPLAGLAEFPGGKCLPGETPHDCAVRECREETGLAVVPIRLLVNQQFEYEHDTVDLHFWICRPANADSVAADHRGFRWVDASLLASLKFPAGNAPVISLLTVC